MVKYKEYKTFRNGESTVVAGYGYEPQHIITKMTQHLGAAAEMGSQLDSYSSPTVKGIARLSPGDTYDAKTGLIVASRKCEIKAIRKTNTTLKRMAKELEATLELIKGEITANTAYAEAIEKKLKEII